MLLALDLVLMLSKVKIFGIAATLVRTFYHIDYSKFLNYEVNDML